MMTMSTQPGRYDTGRWKGAQQICDVQGRLKASLNFWRDTFKATQPVLDWIGDGYKLPLLSVSPP